MNQILIVFVVLVSSSLAAKDTQCQKGGEYCLNHWDCCSNTCLSFLYKCSHIPSTDLIPLDSPALSSPALSSPAQSSSGFFSNKPPPPQSVVLATSSIRPETEPISYESLLEIIFKPLKFEPTAVGRELNSIIPRLDDEKEFNKEEEAIAVTTTDAPPECLEIGAKCYSNEMCCTMRCHGYLHQCVT